MSGRLRCAGERPRAQLAAQTAKHHITPPKRRAQELAAISSGGLLRSGRTSRDASPVAAGQSLNLSGACPDVSVSTRPSRGLRGAPDLRVRVQASSDESFIHWTLSLIH